MTTRLTLTFPSASTAELLRDLLRDGGHPFVAESAHDVTSTLTGWDLVSEDLQTCVDLDDEDCPVHSAFLLVSDAVHQARRS